MDYDKLISFAWPMVSIGALGVGVFGALYSALTGILLPALSNSNLPRAKFKFLMLAVRVLGAFTISALGASLLVFGVGTSFLFAAIILSFIQDGSPVFCVYLVVAALLLYGLRTYRPFIYGSFETAVGVATIYYTLVVNPPLINHGTASSELLSLASGMYVIVRGLDNMSKDLPAAIRPVWLLLRWGKPLKD